ncbi:OmpA family protein [Solitalea koreensis]|uniref:Outer membrane protein OmpA n=1 Tax=Solitalea koreensis TaxID=543615 RepID=A0A521CFK0_9SPHI|nr:OmpA family protein [Solitalea koreensis]SMO58206.1 Outer membrane protein OmpA [Solitalea koreensis]
MANLVESLSGLITPDLISKASGMLGESEIDISKAVGGIMPSVLGGLLNKSSDSSAMSSIFNMIQQTDESVLSNPSLLLGGGGEASAGLTTMGDQFLSLLFGNKKSDVGSMISSFSGVKASSALSLLSFAAPLVMSYLGMKTKEEGLGLSGLTNFLFSQKDNIISAAPAGLSSILGLNSLANLGSNISSRVQSTEQAVSDFADPPVYASSPDMKKSNWLGPLLLALAMLALGIYALKSCNKQPGERTASAVDSLMDTTSYNVETLVDTATAKVNEAWEALGAFFMKTLPNGVELNIPELGVENKLLAFIEDSTKMVDKTTWFSFDRLTFETNSATLKPESEEQLKNIAEILKAYPNVNIKLGGYTDNTGDPKANLKLSQDRANSVKAELEKLGIDAGRLSAEGYGQEYPVADNSTEDGKAKNRRIDIRVTKK